MRISGQRNCNIVRGGRKVETGEIEAYNECLLRFRKRYLDVLNEISSETANLCKGSLPHWTAKLSATMEQCGPKYNVNADDMWIVYVCSAK